MIRFFKAIWDDLFKERIYIYRTPSEIGDTIVAIPAFKIIRDNHLNSKIILINLTNYNKCGFNPYHLLNKLNLVDALIRLESNSLNYLFLIFSLNLKWNKQLYYLNSQGRNNIFTRDFCFFKICGFKKFNGELLNYSNFLRINLNDLSYGKYKESIRLCKLLNFNYKYKIKRPFFDPENEIRNFDDESYKNFDFTKYTIALGIGGKLKEKIWPIERYILLLNRIFLFNKNLNVIIFGGLGDKNNANEIISNVNNTNIISLVDKTTIMQCASIISKCNLYLGNDCGLMHIASMMGLNCIALFSIHQKKGIWEPFGDENIIIRSNLDEKLGDSIDLSDVKKSMELITVQQVYDEVINTLNKAL